MYYPDWICHACGKKYGKVPKQHISTWHQGICGWCRKVANVTEPRDFNYPTWNKDIIYE